MIGNLRKWKAKTVFNWPSCPTSILCLFWGLHYTLQKKKRQKNTEHNLSAGDNSGSNIKKMENKNPMLAVPQLLLLMRFILSLLLHVSLSPLKNFISKQNDKIQLHESLVTIYINLHYACINPAKNYLFKVSNRNSRKRCEICTKLTIKTPERRHWRRSGVFIVNIEHIFIPFSSVSIADFEQVNVAGKLWINFNI